MQCTFVLFIQQTPVYVYYVLCCIVFADSISIVRKHPPTVHSPPDERDHQKTAIFSPGCAKHKISQSMAVKGNKFHKPYTIDICIGGCPSGKLRPKATNASSTTPSTTPGTFIQTCVTTRSGFKNVTHFKGTLHQITVGVETALECGCRRQKV